jgi:putative peptidoglycan lipid II flippase
MINKDSVPKKTASGAPSNLEISKSAFNVTLGNVFGLLAGLGSQVVTALLFGAGAHMDAFLTASVVPLYLSYVLINGLSFVLVPAFIDEETKGAEKDAWSLVGTFMWLTGLVLTIVAFMGSKFSWDIVAITAPRYSQPKIELTSRMLSVLIFTVPFTGLGNLTLGLQNARNRFFWPAMGRTFGSLANVLVLLFFFKSLGPMALAWGYLASEVISGGMTIVPIMRHGWSRLLPITDPRILENAKLMFPFLVFGFFTSSTSVFERFFASGLPDGELSYIGYAYKISSIFIALLASGIAGAVFPAMARSFSTNGKDGLVRQFQNGLRLTIATALPACALVGVLVVPIISVIYERGAFTHTDTINVGRIVLIIMIGDVFFRMLINLIGRAFYVLKDTLTTSIISAAGAILYILIGRILTNHGGYVGLVSAKSIQMGLIVVTAAYLLSADWRFFRSRKLIIDIIFFFFGTLISACVAWLMLRALSNEAPFIQFIGSIVVAGPLYLLLIFWRDRELYELVSGILGIPQVRNKVSTSVKEVPTEIWIIEQQLNSRM